MKIYNRQYNLDGYSTRVNGNISCCFKRSEVSEAFLAVGNKIRELKKTHKQLVVPYWGANIYNNSISINWTRPLNEEEKKQVKVIKKKYAKLEKEREIKRLRATAKKYGLTIK